MQSLDMSYYEVGCVLAIFLLGLGCDFKSSSSSCADHRGDLGLRAHRTSMSTIKFNHISGDMLT